MFGMADMMAQRGANQDFTGENEFKNVIILPDCATCTVTPCPERCLAVNSTDEEMIVVINGQKYVRQSGYHVCSISKSADQLIPKITWTKVLWDVEDDDLNGMHSVVSNTERITFIKPGKYAVGFQIKLATSKDTQVDVVVIKNGTTELLSTCMMSPRDDFTMCIGIKRSFNFVVDDYVEIQVYHNNADDKNLLAGTSTFFEVRRVS